MFLMIGVTHPQSFTTAKDTRSIHVPPQQTTSKTGNAPLAIWVKLSFETCLRKFDPFHYPDPTGPVPHLHLASRHMDGLNGSNKREGPILNKDGGTDRSKRPMSILVPNLAPGPIDVRADRDGVNTSALLDLALVRRKSSF
ncbi:hypothetical protein FRC07_011066 [Ceratobasidium sp. 392]|nr:hypothetical protein FRC07_011066 [Ceratobasidium sp. 392]